MNVHRYNGYALSTYPSVYSIHSKSVAPHWLKQSYVFIWYHGNVLRSLAQNEFTYFLRPTPSTAEEMWSASSDARIMLQVFYYSLTSMRSSHNSLLWRSGERKFLILGCMGTNMLAESVPSQRMGYRYHLHGHVEVKYIHNLSETATHVLVLGLWIPPDVRSPGRLNFMPSRLTSVGPHCRTCLWTKWRL